MSIPRLGYSCKYRYIGVMVYLWIVPEDVKEDTIYRLKLTTDEPPTTQLSGKLQVTSSNASSTLFVESGSSRTSMLSESNMMDYALVAFLFAVLAAATVLRLCRRPQRISL